MQSSSAHRTRIWRSKLHTNKTKNISDELQRSRWTAVELGGQLTFFSAHLPHKGRESWESSRRSRRKSRISCARDQDKPRKAFLRVWSDSDWAGSVKDRKSQSRSKTDVDGCPLYSALRKQKARARSSGEAECYAAASAASETKC